MINFMGTDGFVWFQGKVEDNNDPENIGRCKVRCLGIYSDKIPVSKLPWAHPITPLNTRGLFATPNVGDWVFGFFRDADACQEPMMLGILPGSNTVNKVKEVIAFVKTNGGLDYAIHKMHEFQQEAILILDSFPASDAKDSLQKLVSYVIDREF